MFLYNKNGVGVWVAGLEYDVLKCISEGINTCSEIAKKLNITNGRVSQILRKLTEMGLIELRLKGRKDWRLRPYFPVYKKPSFVEFPMMPVIIATVFLIFINTINVVMHLKYGNTMGLFDLLNFIYSIGMLFVILLHKRELSF